MELNIAVKLIEKGVAREASEIWLDLGAGNGTFTNALATLLAPGSTIYAIDRDEAALKQIAFSRHDVSLKTVKKDFTHDVLDIETPDGILMANSLHFVADKISFIKMIKKISKRGGRVIVVEYDSDKGNHWVPYPISFVSLQKLCDESGVSSVNKIGSTPSIYQRGQMYSALLRL